MSLWQRVQRLSENTSAVHGASLMGEIDAFTEAVGRPPRISEADLSHLRSLPPSQILTEFARCLRDEDLVAILKAIRPNANETERKEIDSSIRGMEQQRKRWEEIEAEAADARREWEEKRQLA